jgi:hypothetical protein
MCFRIDNKHPGSKIAKRDVACYKIVDKYNKRFVSPFLHKPYRIGQIKYATRGGKRLNTLFVDMDNIYAGIHAYSTMYKASRRARLSFRAILYCLIPRGTMYYYNQRRKEYVSTKIKVIKEVKP